MTSTQSDSERTEFYARGFYIDAYQFDGLPTQMVQNWSYGDSGLDLALYDRVEVVRGATGLLSGAGNPSASVNLIRKHADSAELAGSVSVNVGSWGRTRTTWMGSALNASGTVRGRVIGSYLDTDAQMDRYNQHKTLGYAVIDADLTPDTQLSVGYDYQQKRANGATWVDSRCCTRRLAHRLRRIVQRQPELDLLGYHQQARLRHPAACLQQWLEVQGRRHPR
jgi:outer membrane receptor for ferric coprogen and ferric-rhodotorulic acid